MTCTHTYICKNIIIYIYAYDIHICIYFIFWHIEQRLNECISICFTDSSCNSGEYFRKKHTSLQPFGDCGSLICMTSMPPVVWHTNHHFFCLNMDGLMVYDGSVQTEKHVGPLAPFYHASGDPTSKQTE